MEVKPNNDLIDDDDEAEEEEEQITIEKLNELLL